MPSWSSGFAVRRRRRADRPHRAARLSRRRAARRSSRWSTPARTEGEVARVTADELCEAFEAEIAVVWSTGRTAASAETIGLDGAEPGARPSRRRRPARHARALGSRAPGVHAGEDLLGAGLRQLVLSPWTADSGRQVVIGVGRLLRPALRPGRGRAPAGGHAERRPRARALVAGGRARPARRPPERAGPRRQVAPRRPGRPRGAAHAVPRRSRGRSRPTWSACSAPARAAADGGGRHGPARGRRLPARARRGRRAARPAARAACSAFAEDPATAGARAPRARIAPAWSRRFARRTASTGSSSVGCRGDRWIEREDVELLVAFADLAAVACRNAAEHAAAPSAAALDSLTGCLNHGAFHDRLQRGDRPGGPGRAARWRSP